MPAIATFKTSMGDFKVMFDRMDECNMILRKGNIPPGTFRRGCCGFALPNRFVLFLPLSHAEIGRNLHGANAHYCCKLH
jgi:hypothetical protein